LDVLGSDSYYSSEKYINNDAIRTPTLFDDDVTKYIAGTQLPHSNFFRVFVILRRPLMMQSFALSLIIKSSATISDDGEN